MNGKSELKQCWFLFRTCSEKQLNSPHWRLLCIPHPFALLLHCKKKSETQNSQQQNTYKNVIHEGTERSRKIRKEARRVRILREDEEEGVVGGREGGGGGVGRRKEGRREERGVEVKKKYDCYKNMWQTKVEIDKFTWLSNLDIKSNIKTYNSLMCESSYINIFFTFNSKGTRMWLSSEPHFLFVHNMLSYNWLNIQSGKRKLEEVYKKVHPVGKWNNVAKLILL